ncbi:MAG: DUF4907 domain-containing protein [Bacteroidetes bacterium]|nr:DUF4907 domain-containing protein [Bacteroidota bacterium]MBS1930560.1 DUF4907 domain-containing protein [Bacteroidota bacterium]
MRFLFFIFSFLFVFNCVHAQQFPASVKDAKLGYKIISVENNTWGYDIYNGTRLFVHQPTIPAMPGNKGFKSKQFAEKVAKKVIEKIKKGGGPPTITIDEMKQLGVIAK